MARRSVVEIEQNLEEQLQAARDGLEELDRQKRLLSARIEGIELALSVVKADPSTEAPAPQEKAEKDGKAPF